MFGASGSDGVDWKWTPSIHMPRTACRTVLEITEIRVQRLQECSEEDALAEGVRRLAGQLAGAYICGGSMSGTTAVECYKRLWESINGKGSWGANPFVWCLSFRKVTA